MFNRETVEDISYEINALDVQIRKSLNLPDEGFENPAQVIVTLAGLARAASSAAQAVSLVMSSARERDLLEKRLRAQIDSGE